MKRPGEYSDEQLWGAPAAAGAELTDADIWGAPESAAEGERLVGLGERFGTHAGNLVTSNPIVATDRTMRRAGQPHMHPLGAALAAGARNIGDLTGYGHDDDARQAAVDRFEALPSFMDEPGLGNKLLAGTANVGGMLAGSLADPLNVIGSGAGSVLKAIGANAAANVALDTPGHIDDVQMGVQDGFSPTRVGTQAALGGILGATPGAIGQLRDWWQRRGRGADVSRMDDAELVEMLAQEAGVDPEVAEALRAAGVPEEAIAGAPGTVGSLTRDGTITRPIGATGRAAEPAPEVPLDPEFAGQAAETLAARRARDAEEGRGRPPVTAEGAPPERPNAFQERRQRIENDREVERLRAERLAAESGEIDPAAASTAGRVETPPVERFSVGSEGRAAPDEPGANAGRADAARVKAENDAAAERDFRLAEKAGDYRKARAIREAQWRANEAERLRQEQELETLRVRGPAADTTADPVGPSGIVDPATARPAEQSADASPRDRRRMGGGTLEGETRVTGGTGDRPFVEPRAGRDSPELSDRLDADAQRANDDFFRQRAETKAENERLRDAERLEAEWENRARDKARAEENAQARARTEEAAGGEFDEQPGKADATGFWRVNDDGILVGKTGKPVRFRSQKAAARWAARNGQGAYFDQVAGRTNTTDTMLRARDAYYRDRDTAAAGQGGQQVAEGSDDAPPRESAGPAGLGAPPRRLPDGRASEPEPQAETPAPTGRLKKPKMTRAEAEAKLAERVRVAADKAGAKRPRKRPAVNESTTDAKGEPRTLVQWLKAKGGVRDSGGELKARDARLQAPGLVSRRGMNLDDAALAATEAGYIGKRGERGSIDELLSAIDDDFAGRRRYTDEGQARIDEREAAEEGAEVIRGIMRDAANLKAEAKAAGYQVSAAQRLEAAERAARTGQDPIDALDDIVMEEAIRFEADFDAGPVRGPDGADDIPFESAGARGEGSARGEARADGQEAGPRPGREAGGEAPPRGRASEPEAKPVRKAEAETPAPRAEGPAAPEPAAERRAIDLDAEERGAFRSMSSREPLSDAQVETLIRNGWALEDGTGLTPKGERMLGTFDSARRTPPRQESRPDPEPLGARQVEPRTEQRLNDGRNAEQVSADLEAKRVADQAAKREAVKAKRREAAAKKKAEAETTKAAKGSTSLYSNPIGPLLDYIFNGKEWAKSGREVKAVLKEWLRRPGRKDGQSALGAAWRVTVDSSDSEGRAILSKGGNNSKTGAWVYDQFHAKSGSGAAGSADGRGTYPEAVTTRVNRQSTVVQKIADLIDEFGLDGEQVIKMVENPAARRGKAGDAAKMIEGFFKEHHAYLKEAGVELGDVKNYFRRAYDSTKIGADREGFLEAASRAYRLDGLAKNKAEGDEMALALWMNQTFGTITAPGRGQMAGKGSPFHSRVFSPRAAKLLDPYRNKDVVAVLSGYAATAARRAEVARRFGDNWSGWADIEKKVRDEGGAGALEHMRKHAELMTGLAHRDVGMGVNVFSSVARTWTTVSLLDRVFFTSVAEPLTAVAQTGNYADGFRALRDSIAQLIRGTKGDQLAMKNLAEDLGVIMSEGSSGMMAARWAGGDPTTKGEAFILSRFFRGIQMEQLTNAGRISGMRTALRFTKRLAEEHATNPKRAAFFLEDLGVPKDVVPDFIALRKKIGDRIPTAEELAEHGAAGRALATAMMRMSDRIIQRPDVSTRPRWASHPLGKIIFQLRAFGMAFEKNVLLRPNEIRKAVKRGDLDKGNNETGKAYAALIAGTLLPLTIAHAAMSDIRSRVSNPERHERESAGFKLERGMSYSGMLGKFDPVYQLLGGTRYGATATDVMLGPTVGTTNKWLQSNLDYFINNNPRTNTAERNAVRDNYRFIAEPLMQIALARVPVGEQVGLVTDAANFLARSYGVRALEKPVVSGVAGERQRENTDAVESSVAEAWDNLRNKFGQAVNSPKASGGRGSANRGTVNRGTAERGSVSR